MIVQHPAFKSVTHDVDNPEDWVAQGWKLLDEKPASAESPKPGPRDKK